jgi:pimeloyl-ACP methyl ester carboxylesterase
VKPRERTIIFTYDATSHVAQSAAGRQHYHEAGEGPVLLLLHGSGPGVTGWANFSENLTVFAPNFRTVILDLPGYGGSDPAEGNPMAAGADAVVAFMAGSASPRRTLSVTRSADWSARWSRPIIRSGSTGSSPSAGSGSACSARFPARASTC